MQKEHGATAGEARNAAPHPPSMPADDPGSIRWGAAASDLLQICPGRVQQNVDLRALSRWRIGGRAALLVHLASAGEVAEVVRYTNDHRIPRVVIGGTSNLLFDDAGLEALLLRIGPELATLSIEGRRVTGAAGVWVPRLARRAAASGLGGLQHAIGIPGTLGGLICMNGGSQRKGIGDHIAAVTCITQDGLIRTMGREECRFGYRYSVFQGNGAIVVGCSLELEPANARLLRREMLDVLRSRRQRFPLKLPNCGSVFVSNPALNDLFGPPAKIIEEAGLKGYRIGGAEVSTTHANFIVNRGDATSMDVLQLIQKVRQRVFERTGFWLACEVRHVSRSGVVSPAHL